jgi:hypothetical protein
MRRWLSVAVDRDKAMACHFDPLIVTVERGRLGFFAKATGQRDPVYAELPAAVAAGHPDLPVPPSFYFSLELDRPDPFGWLTALGIDLRRVLHGEQSFAYHAMAHGGGHAHSAFAHRGRDCQEGRCAGTAKQADRGDA